MPKGLNSNVKHFVDDTSLFSVVYDPRVTIETLNEVLSKVSQWAHQWKMLFNRNSSKQAKEIVFSRKNRATNYGNVSIINSENVLKHLGLSLDVRLNFVENTNAQIKKANKGISVIRKFHLSLPRISLLTIYKLFVRPQPNNSTLSNNIECVQYNAALSTTGAIRRTSREKLYLRLCYFHKLLLIKLPPYLCDFTPPLQRSHRNPGCFKVFKYRTELFQNLFSLHSVNNWS